MILLAAPDLDPELGGMIFCAHRYLQSQRPERKGGLPSAVDLASVV
jgi:hypothetical protein